MVEGIISTLAVMMVPMELGSMCLNISLMSLEPRVRLASTYSLPLNL